ncbi:MAG: hypothetical protein Q8P41_09280 [Pseudomonadota bacterium]|nr:hypothetical protein [Pseudomonadota bacterium]
MRDPAALGANVLDRLSLGLQAWLREEGEGPVYVSVLLHDPLDDAGAAEFARLGYAAEPGESSCDGTATAEQIVDLARDPRVQLIALDSYSSTFR